MLEAWMLERSWLKMRRRRQTMEEDLMTRLQTNWCKKKKHPRLYLSKSRMHFWLHEKSVSYFGLKKIYVLSAKFSYLFPLFWPRFASQSRSYKWLCGGIFVISWRFGRKVALLVLIAEICCYCWDLLSLLRIVVIAEIVCILGLSNVQNWDLKL